jgi:hypothetical protein
MMEDRWTQNRGGAGLFTLAAAAVLRLGWVKEGETPGRRVLVQAAHVTKEDEEAPRECFTGDEAPGRPVMARRRDPLGGGTHTKVEMDEGLGRGKRVQ